MSASIPIARRPASPAPTAARSAPPSFARRRLRLGITGVGLSVLLSLAWIAVTTSGLVQLPVGWHPLSRSFGLVADAAIAVLLVFVAHALLLVTVEYRGGVVEVRTPPSRAAWFARWTRAVVCQGVLFAALAATLAAGASLAGALGAALAATAAIVVLLAWQGRIARWLAPFPLRPADARIGAIALANGVRPGCVRVADTGDEAFVGGWIGLRRPELWIPARWSDASMATLLSVQMVRRHHQWHSGARRRGLLRATLWNLAGVLLLAPLLPWPMADARTFLVLPALATLWSFVAVLLLPTPSRQAVLHADRAAAARLGSAPVGEAITQLDRWQDDEAERSGAVEAIFHPVPSRGNRLRALASGGPVRFGGGHQLTRLTLYTSIASLSLLGRAVHCNIGRPELWVIYPGD